MNLIPLNFITQGEQTPLRRMMLERALAGGGALSEYEITGNPVVFNTNVAKPLSGFTIPFLPVQQGTGDPSPQNPRHIIGWQGLTAWGTAETLIDSTKRYVSSSSQVYIGNVGTGYTIELSSGTYTFAIGYKSSTGYDVYYKGESLSQTRIINRGTVAEPYIATTTFTIAESDTFRLWLYSSNGVSVDNIAWFTLVEGTKPLIPATYPVTFPALGKNLLNPEILNLAPSGNTFIQNDVYRGMCARVPSAGKYTISRNEISGNRFRILASAEKPAVGVSMIVLYDSSDEALSATVTVPEGYGYIYVFLSNNSHEITSNIQCESGSTATAYEPYTNTVYGGTLDAVNGVLTADTEFVSFRWGDVNGSSVGDYTRKMVTGRMSNYPNHKYTPVCNVAKYKANFSEDSLHFYVNSAATNNVIVFLPNDADEDTIVQVAYPLAAPIEIQLDPITVQTLIGDNTIWTDTNGENTVKYLKKG